MNKCLTKNVDNNEESSALVSRERVIYTSRSSTDELDIEELDSCTEGAYSDLYETFPEMRRGGYGVVCKARNKVTGEEAITKFIYKNYIDDDWYITYNKVGMVPKEIGILHQLDHPNIIKLLGFYQNKDWYQLVMEKHGPGIDLYDFTDRLQQPLQEDLGSYIFQQVVSAVRYLHERFLVHRDIKDENIIIDERFSVKLVDFGTATHVDHFSLLDDFEGTTKVFSSPEYLRKEKYDGYAMDIWALGVTLYLLMYGDTPFETEEEVVTFQGSLEFPEKSSNELQQLLQNMLNPFPQDRYNIKEVYNHTWTTQAININKYVFEEVICTEETNWDVMKPEQYYTPREENFVLNLRELRNYNSDTDEEMDEWITVSEINSDDYENELYGISDDILDNEIENLTESPTMEESKMSTDNTEEKKRDCSSEKTTTFEDLGSEQRFLPGSNTMDMLNDSESSTSVFAANNSQSYEHFTYENKKNFCQENQQSNYGFLNHKHSTSSREFVNDWQQNFFIPNKISSSDYYISNGHLVKKCAKTEITKNDLAYKQQQMNRSAKSVDRIDVNLKHELNLNPENNVKCLPENYLHTIFKTNENSHIDTKKCDLNKIINCLAPKSGKINHEETVNILTKSQNNGVTNVKNKTPATRRQNLARSASACQ